MDLNEFIASLQELNIQIDEKKLNQLHAYYELLVEYNKVMNLTGITEEKDVYLKHFYDSLTLARIYSFDKDESLCDVGTGAGFPGIVLKILYPNLHITLVDSLNKRIEFLKIVIEKLNLQKIEVVSARAEEYAKSHRDQFDIVTARAVAPLSTLLEYSIPMLKVGGYFLPMKGTVSFEEENTQAFSLLNAQIEKKDCFLLPKENSHRTLYVILKKEKTPLKYPRKFSDMKKKPL